MFSGISRVKRENLIEERKAQIDDDHECPSIIPEKIVSQQNDEGQKVVGEGMHDEWVFSKDIDLFDGETPLYYSYSSIKHDVNNIKLMNQNNIIYL